MTASTTGDSQTARESFGDALAAGFELVATPAIFALLGWFIDGRLGTFPIFTLALIAVTLSYEVWKLWSNYSAQMDAALEERRAGYHRSPPSPGGAAP